MNDRSYTGGPPAGEWHLEDFRVGQRWTTVEREVTAADVADFARLSGDTHPLHVDEEYAASTRFGVPIAHGPLGVAVTMGLLHELHLVDTTIVALLGTTWRYLAPIRPGDRVHAELLITGVRRTREGSTGVVDRDLRLVGSDGTVVQEGQLPCLVRARGAGPDPAERAFGTTAWGELLARSLADDRAFASATATWDGAIGLHCGEQGVQLRIYRGTVLEVARRTPSGPTFALHASPRAWTELALGPTNDLIQRSGRGEFTMSGNAYEYLRLTKAVHLLVDAARALAGKDAA